MVESTLFHWLAANIFFCITVNNNVAGKYLNGMTIKHCVTHLLEGWYGNHFMIIKNNRYVPEDYGSKAVNCNNLVKHSIWMVDEKNPSMWWYN